MSGRLLIYGASGFTGRLILQEALALGLRPVIGGRTRSKLEALARPDRLTYRTAALSDRVALSALLENIDVVMNAAGPFGTTAAPLADACIDQAVHYLDISGELAAFEQLAARDRKARDQGIMLLPGTGFDVVVSDAAAALAARRVPKARELLIAFTGLDAISRGSAQTVFEHFDEHVTVRRRGSLRQVAPGALMRHFDFGDGPRPTTALSWADVCSAYHTTGIPNISVYYDLTPIVRFGLAVKQNASWVLKTRAWRLWQGALIRLLPDGPSPEARARGAATVVVQAFDRQGYGIEVRVRTPEVYSLTALSSVAIAERVLEGDYKPGFQTPAGAYGADHGLSLPGVSHVVRRLDRVHEAKRRSC
jgi:short subunit dehydrogenase-like uncharacterized protein